MRHSRRLPRFLAMGTLALTLEVTALSGCMLMHAHETPVSQTRAEGQPPAEHGSGHAAGEQAPAEPHAKGESRGHGMMGGQGAWAWVAGAAMVAMMIVIML